MTKAECGSLGGKKTVEKYGKSYMQTLARCGAAAMHAKYKLEPIGQNDFAIINRETGQPNRKTLNGRLL